jgi:hypothetical protein
MWRNAIAVLIVLGEAAQSAAPPVEVDLGDPNVGPARAVKLADIRLPPEDFWRQAEDYWNKPQDFSGEPQRFRHMQPAAIASSLCGSVGAPCLSFDIWNEEDGVVLEDIWLDFAAEKGMSLADALHALAARCPELTWAVHEGVVILNARPLAEMNPDPLASPIPPMSYEGRADDVLLEIRRFVPGLDDRFCILGGGSWRMPVIAFRTSTAMRLDTLLARLQLCFRIQHRLVFSNPKGSRPPFGSCSPYGVECRILDDDAAGSRQREVVTQPLDATRNRWLIWVLVVSVVVTSATACAIWRFVLSRGAA